MGRRSIHPPAWHVVVEASGADRGKDAYAAEVLANRPGTDDQDLGCP
jgi:hypothetical protein